MRGSKNSDPRGIPILRLLVKYWKGVVVFCLSLAVSFVVTLIIFPYFRRLPELLSRKTFFDVSALSGIVSGQNMKGVSWGDFDNDGYDDLLIGGKETKLYRNRGNGTFEDVTQEVGLGVGFSTSSGVFGDYDNDGCRDLFLAGSNARSYLFHNKCDSTFEDLTESSGISGKRYNSMGASWGDYDNDGFLDLYVANYGVFNFNDSTYTLEPNILYHNLGNGTFEDVTEKAGVSGLTECRAPAGEGLKFLTKSIKIATLKASFQPVWFDYNNDNSLDLFITTDYTTSPLYRNDGAGHFTEVTRETGLCRSGTNMGVAVGDFDNDGDLDLYVTNVGANYLWRNNGKGTFSEDASSLAVTDYLSVGWGTGFFDFDNDGVLDLYVVNGTVRDKGEPPIAGEKKEDRLFKNMGDKFVDVGSVAGISGSYPKTTLAFADFDNNGFLDIFVVKQDFDYIGGVSFDSAANLPGKSLLYKNRGSGNHWLKVKVEGTRSNTDSVGAKITVRWDGGEQIEQVLAGGSFLGQNSLWQVFGLGISDYAKEVTVKWPSGAVKTLHDVKANQSIRIKEK